MRKIYIILVFLALFSVGTASAVEVSIPSTVPQGKTLKITVPVTQNMQSISGVSGNNPIVFAREERQPADEEHISRAEFLFLLFNNSTLARSGVGIQGLFPDVPVQYSFSSAIYSARALGLVHGYEDGSFYPETSLTRAQASKILISAFPQERTTVSTTFTDLAQSHSLYRYMQQAIESGLFQGYGDGTVKPDRALRYDEAETLLKRVTEKSTLSARPNRKEYSAFLGFHRVNDIGRKNIIITVTSVDGSKESTTHAIEVTKQQYPTTSFNLPPSKTSLFAQEAYNKTWEMIDSAKKSTSNTKLWEGTFIVPAEGEVSMGFGDTVYINGALSGSHFGIDYANKTGTPVLASNHGNVVLSTYTPSYGNTVIIDHGMNVFTMYMHMSALLVEQGRSVRKGDTIGRIGATGIATGPHLHFTHFIGNIIVDSKEWFEESF